MITVDTTCSSEGNSRSALTIDDDVLSSEEKIVGGKQFFSNYGIDASYFPPLSIYN
jgi:hypothetical protein